MDLDLNYDHSDFLLTDSYNLEKNDNKDHAKSSQCNYNIIDDDLKISDSDEETAINRPLDKSIDLKSEDSNFGELWF